MMHARVKCVHKCLYTARIALHTYIRTYIHTYMPHIYVLTIGCTVDCCCFSDYKHMYLRTCIHMYVHASTLQCNLSMKHSQNIVGSLPKDSHICPSRIEPCTAVLLN